MSLHLFGCSNTQLCPARSISMTGQAPPDPSLDSRCTSWIGAMRSSTPPVTPTSTTRTIVDVKQHTLSSVRRVGRQASRQPVPP